MRLDGNTATVQGLLYTEDEAGNVSYVDKTWGYQKDDSGAVKIVPSSRRHTSPSTPPMTSKTMW